MGNPSDRLSEGCSTDESWTEEENSSELADLIRDATPGETTGGLTPRLQRLVSESLRDEYDHNYQDAEELSHAH